MAADTRTDQEIADSLPTETEFDHATRRVYLYRFETMQRDFRNFMESDMAWKGRVEEKLDGVIAEADANRRLRRTLLKGAAIVGGVVSFLVTLASQLWAYISNTVRIE